MNKEIVLEKINEIDADLIVLKGFPVSIIEEIGREYPLLDSYIYGDGKIILENINAQKFMQGIFMSSGKMICSCESFISFCNNFTNLSVLGKKIKVLENNLLTLYPNPSDCDIPDFDSDEIEEETTSPYSVCYSYAEERNGEICVQYIDNYTESNPEVAAIPLITPRPFVTYTNEAEIAFDVLTNVKIETLLTSFNKNDSISSEKAYSINLNEIDQSRLEVLFGVADYLGKEIDLYRTPAIPSIEPRKELLFILKDIWGYDSFRNLQIYEDLKIDRRIKEMPQNEVMEIVIRECEKGFRGDPTQQMNNVLLTAPTGAGKSILYQLTAIYLARRYEAMTIVISPLVALMDDQVDGLAGYDRIATINSNRSATEKAMISDQIVKGEIDILYLAPEMLLSYDIRTFIGTRRLGLIVIDEAHTVTTWGRDFRPDYLFLGDYIRKARKTLRYTFPIFAVTATAVWDSTHKNDMVYETISSLHMDPCLIFLGNVKRTNIGFEIKASDITKNYEQKRNELTIERIREAIRKGKKMIVYFPYKKTIKNLLKSEEIADIKDKIASYHAELYQNEKIQNALDFKSGKKTIMLATKAYGMGVDVNDIEEVYHHAPSGNLSDYVQEVGRIARDPKIQGVARLDFSPYDLRYKRRLEGASNIRPYQLQEVLNKIMSLFKMNGERRNMLISASDFSYVFPNSDTATLDRNVKNSLLLISNDLLNKLRFLSLIVRPKSIYSKCYVSVPHSQSKRFYKCYRKYVNQVEDNIFYLQADLLWQDKFSNISFPQFKWHLANNKIFDDFEVSLKTKIDVDLKHSLKDTYAKISEFFQLANGFIKWMATEGHRLAFEKMKEGLPTQWDTERKERFLETFKTIYATPKSDGSPVYCGLHQKNDEEMTQSFQFLQAGYESVQNRYLRIFKDYFNEDRFTSFVGWDSEVYKVCEFLSSLGVADYKRQGGDEPMISVRINNPWYLNGLVRKKNYQNAILKGIYDKQAYAERVFTYFFTTPMTDEERWDFIESYFLGVPEEELLK